MDESKQSLFREAASELTNNQTDNERLSTLTRAIELFGQETDRLEGAYNSLKEEFTSIHYELEATNKKLNYKLAELGAMAFYLESILSNMAQGILFIDLNGDITTYNTAAEALLDVKRERVLYCPFWKNFSDKLFGFSLREALATRNVPTSSTTTLEKEGHISRDLEVNATFVSEEAKSALDPSGEEVTRKLEGIIILIRDITEIRTLQLIASRSDRMKELGEMAASVAHEIRNPLGGIKGFASLLRRDLEEDSRLAEMASHIIKGTETLNHLVTNVLNYSRPISPKLEEYNVICLLNETLEYFEVDIKQSNHPIKVIIEAEEKELLLKLDPQLFKSALLNLLYNARDAMKEGGNITVSIETLKQLAIIKICDEGCGIATENLEKIFNPLFTTKPEGNGFGLAEVHKVVQAHFGVIEVESIIGEGTTFIITLPLIEKEL